MLTVRDTQQIVRQPVGALMSSKPVREVFKSTSGMAYDAASGEQGHPKDIRGRCVTAEAVRDADVNPLILLDTNPSEERLRNWNTGKYKFMLVNGYEITDGNGIPAEFSMVRRTYSFTANRIIVVSSVEPVNVHELSAPLTASSLQIGQPSPPVSKVKVPTVDVTDGVIGASITHAFRSAVKSMATVSSAGNLETQGSIHLVGTNHQDALGKKEIQKYVQKAAQGELAVFLEGVSADPARAQPFIQQAFGTNGNSCFGYEADIANAISGTLLHLGYCRAKGIESQAAMGNLQTCYDLATNDDMRAAWAKVPSDLPIRKRVDAILQDTAHLDAKSLVNEIHTKHKDVLASPGWIEVYPYLFEGLKERVPSELKAPLENPQISTYLRSANNVEQEYVVHEINNNWRNDFIVRNIAQAVSKNRLNDKDVYVFIGAMHVDKIAQPLSRALGVPVREHLLKQGRLTPKPESNFEGGRKDFV